MVEGFTEPAHPHVPVKTPYVFRREPLCAVLAFLANPAGDGFHLTGPTGAGKTLLALQAADRLQRVQDHPGLPAGAFV